MADQIQPRPRGNPKWRAGGPSPNPGGRPAGIAERLRTGLLDATGDLAEVIEYLASVVRDPDAHARDRIAAAALILDRTAGKAPQEHVVSAQAAIAPAIDVRALPEASKLALLEAIEAARAALPPAPDGS